VKILEPSPYGRLTALVLAVGAILCSSAVTTMLAALALAEGALLFSSPARKAHYVFLTWAILPFALCNIFLWGWLIGAPPGLPHGSDAQGGVLYAAAMTARLALLAAAFQLCFSGQSVPQLLALFRSWGIKGDLLLIVAGAFTLWPELRERIDHVVTARYARGLVRKRSILGSIIAFPFVLRPVIFGSLHHSVERADMWQRQGLLNDVVEQDHYGRQLRFVDILWIGLTLMWLVVIVSSR
jgi:energy-coupling factor transporter transmembrane protein EcfT